MNLLLDTHVLLWVADGSERLSSEALALLNDSKNTLFFSAVSLLEITIKCGLGRSDFAVDHQKLYEGLVRNGYQELPITSAHCMSISVLPSLHKDPFDRLLVAQASQEQFTLVTADSLVSQYSAAIIKI